MMTAIEGTDAAGGQAAAPAVAPVGAAASGAAASPARAAPPAKRRQRAPEVLASAPDAAAPADSSGTAAGSAHKKGAARPKAKAGRKKKKRRKKKKQPLGPTKEPQAAADYLHAWAAQQVAQDSGEALVGLWRFNKATQAWLLRHAYENDKVAKDAFRLLLRYLQGLKGAARERLRSEAGAIVALGGARLAPPPLPEAKPGSSRAKKEAARRGQKAKREAEEPPAAREAREAAEVKQRKLRLRRAQQVLDVVGVEEGDEDGAAEAED